MDDLTRIHDLENLIEILNVQMEDAKKSGHKLAIALIDIDNLKMIHDQYGYVAGDMVLCEVAGVLKGSIRKGDVVGRYGGEEFMLILPHTNLRQAFELSERIRNCIENNRFSNGIRLTISGAVKQYTGESLAELVHDVDQNLYKAKKLGRNRIACFD